VVSPGHEERLRASARRPIVCGRIDMARVCVSEASYSKWRDAAPMSE
jgi:hypothetical protein